jgi:hypothetical protein
MLGKAEQMFAVDSSKAMLTYTRIYICFSLFRFLHLQKEKKSDHRHWFSSLNETEK